MTEEQKRDTEPRGEKESASKTTKVSFQGLVFDAMYRAASWFHERPTIAITAIIGWVSVSGFLFRRFQLWHYDINYSKYARVEDYSPAGMIPLLGVMVWVGGELLASHREYLEDQDEEEPHWGPTEVMRGFVFGMFVAPLFGLLAPLIFETTASVTLKDGSQLVEHNELVIVTSIGDQYVFHDNKTKKSYVLPSDSILKIVHEPDE